MTMNTLLGFWDIKPDKEHFGWSSYDGMVLLFFDGIELAE